jgi:putative ABC transport system ATP-binding protein
MATIKIQNLLPEPLKEIDVSSSDIWKSDLIFEASQFVKVQAPSGKGKSTFINILFGNRTDYIGDAFIDGVNVRKFSLNDWSKARREKLSVVFQDLRLLPEFTGIENIMLKASLIEYYDEQQIIDMAELLGVKKLLNKKAALMSYGERQRFAIIRSLVQPFETLLLDEPFSHLDKSNIAKASKLIVDECRKRNAGLILCGLDDDALIPYDKKVLL